MSTSTPAAAVATENSPPLILSSSFSDWLASVDAALTLTTYQAGRLFFIWRGLSRNDAAERHWIGMVLALNGTKSAPVCPV